VLQVYPTSSQVLMINDQSSGVGAMLEKSRLQGVARGTPDGELILERVMSDEQVAVGEIVLSSGGDQIFPKGLPLGAVSKVSPGREMFLNILVRPAADLSRVEEVLVVTEKKVQEPVADTGARVRAADILAQRLPSVPDKPAAAAGADPASTAAGATTGQGAEPGAGAKPQPNNFVKPLTGTVTATTGDVLKKVVQKPAAGDSATNTGSLSGAGSSAALSPVSTGSKAISKPANSAVKPAAAPAKPATAQPKPPATQPKPPATQPKPASAQPAPQPPATEDSPN
jgi:rod shape-determining protein MreC